MSEPCVKSDKIDRLEVDVITINERLNRHSDKIDRISDNNIVLETILRRLEEDGKEQKSVNESFNESMQSIQVAMAEITFNIRELNAGLINTNKKVDETNSKVNKVDDRGKFDFVDFIKVRVIPVLLTSGCLYGLAKFIEGVTR